MIARHSDDNYHPILPGIDIKTLVHGDSTLMTEFHLAKGALLPDHRHSHEQTGYLVTGRMVLHVGDVCRELAPGDSWNIPSNVPHRAEVLENSVAVEVFSPAREDYLRYADTAAVIGCD